MKHHPRSLVCFSVANWRGDSSGNTIIQRSQAADLLPAPEEHFTALLPYGEVSGYGVINLRETPALPGNLTSIPQSVFAQQALLEKNSVTRHTHESYYICKRRHGRSHWIACQR